MVCCGIHDTCVHDEACKFEKTTFGHCNNRVKFSIVCDNYCDSYRTGSPLKLKQFNLRELIAKIYFPPIIFRVQNGMCIIYFSLEQMNVNELKKKLTYTIILIS